MKGMNHTLLRVFISRTLSLSLLAVLVFHASAAASDSSTGTLRGTVTAVGANSQAYNIPGATLQLSGSLPGSLPLSVASNETGEYKFANLSPGLYTLEITLGGFKTLSRKITIRAGETTVEDIFVWRSRKSKATSL
jgi:hypothetical protein